MVCERKQMRENETHNGWVSAVAREFLLTTSLINSVREATRIT